MKNLIQTKIPNVYAVKVPMDSNEYLADIFRIQYTDYRVLGYLTKSEISFDASEVVEKSVLSDNLYKDYSDKWLHPLTAEQSFRSALPEDIYFEYNFEFIWMPCAEVDKRNKSAQDNITEKLLILQKV
jgi:hypothetical protein